MKRMKLYEEYKKWIPMYRNRKEAIINHAEKLKQNGNFKVFEVRLAWDVLHGIVGTGEICSWYDRYNANDNHVETLAKSLLKGVYPC